MAVNLPGFRPRKRLMSIVPSLLPAARFPGGAHEPGGPCTAHHAPCRQLEACFDELTELEAIDTGHPIRDTQRLDLPRTLLNFRYFGGLADKIDARQVPG